MIKYNIYQGNIFVGFTTNRVEMNNYIAAHSGGRVEMKQLPEGTPHGSTLPKVQDDPAPPKGDHLQQ